MGPCEMFGSRVMLECCGEMHRSFFMMCSLGRRLVPQGYNCVPGRLVRASEIYVCALGRNLCVLCMYLGCQEKCLCFQWSFWGAPRCLLWCPGRCLVPRGGCLCSLGRCLYSKEKCLMLSVMLGYCNEMLVVPGICFCVQGRCLGIPRGCLGY